MACTTILVGKKASYDGSTMIARNDDSPSGCFTPKKFVVFSARKESIKYKSVISKQEIELPPNALRCTATPNVIKGKGVWAAGGANEKDVAMTATETITSNERVLGADPLMQKGGIGEEDLVAIVLPYINSAREGVMRLGSLLKEYGTYEMNGIAFSDKDEIWWLETIGGHHFIARRVPDDRYVVMPNQFGLDNFDFADAFGEQKENICSEDLKEFITQNNLDLRVGVKEGDWSNFNPRIAFGSHSDADHVYNTPRAWFMERYLNPKTYKWDGEDADYKPESDDIPWSLVPENKITVEDVKYVLSSHFQGTEYDPYASYGEKSHKGQYRSIGINRNDFLGLFQIRGSMPCGCRAIEWLAFSSNAFNVMVPFYTNIEKTPHYMSCTTENVSTDNFYWNSRLISALTDASYKKSLNHVEHYQTAVGSQSHAIIKEFDAKIKEAASSENATIMELCYEANEKTTSMLKKETSDTLNHVLYETSNLMKNSYSRSDA